MKYVNRCNCGRKKVWVLEKLDMTWIPCDKIECKQILNLKKLLVIRLNTIWVKLLKRFYNNLREKGLSELLGYDKSSISLWKCEIWKFRAAIVKLSFYSLWCGVFSKIKQGFTCVKVNISL